MAAITLATAQSMLQKWLDAEAKLALGQSVAVDGQAVTFARTREYIDYWVRQVDALTDAASSSSGGAAAPFAYSLVNFKS
jgi:hypothetical protein